MTALPAIFKGVAPLALFAAISAPVLAGVLAATMMARGLSRARLNGMASEHFTYQEWLRTATGLPNLAGSGELANMRATSENVLEAIRLEWGPLVITSGFRSPAVNDAVGGASSSQHMKGEAADFAPVNAPASKVYEWMYQNRTSLPIDKAILYHSSRGGHIHISHRRKRSQRREWMYAPENSEGYITYTGTGSTKGNK